MRATPARPRSSRPATSPPCPDSPASSRAAAARSSATAATTSATGPALAVRICVHSALSPAAILVTSRRPCPASPSASAGTDEGASLAAIATATRCGACDTSATQRSWVSGSVVTGTAPHATASEVTAATAAARRLRQRAQRPGPAEEQVGLGGGGPVPLPARQRMRGHVRLQVAAEFPCLRDRQRLHAGDVGVPLRDRALLRVAEHLPDHGRRHREHGDVRDPLGVAQVRHHDAGPEVGRELRRRLVGVAQPHVGALGAQREGDRGPDQPGPRDEHPPRHGHYWAMSWRSPTAPRR